MAIKFELSDIPENSEIRSATLSFYPYEVVTGCKNGKKTIAICTSEWTETGITWNKDPDISTDELAISDVSTVKVWEDFNVTKAIDDFVNNGVENNGFMVYYKYTVQQPAMGIRIRSAQYTNQEYRPKLVVTYGSSTDIVPDKLSIVPNTMCRVTITNVQGRVIESYTTRNPEKLHLRNVSSGIHFMIIKAGGKQTIKKFFH